FVAPVKPDHLGAARQFDRGHGRAAPGHLHPLPAPASLGFERKPDWRRRCRCAGAVRASETITVEFSQPIQRLVRGTGAARATIPDPAETTASIAGTVRGGGMSFLRRRRQSPTRERGRFVPSLTSFLHGGRKPLWYLE